MPFAASELRKFTEAGHAIAKAAGVGFEVWAEGEMGVVLKSWAARTTPIAPAKATIEARTSAGKRAFGATKASRSEFGITVNSGRRDGEPGKVWYRHTKSRKFQMAGKVQNDSAFIPARVHWKNAVWEKIQTGTTKYLAELARLKPAVQKAIGLARQSVIQSADTLGIALESVRGGGNISPSAISKARGAIATSGKAYQNGTGTKTKTAGEFFIEAVNTYPLNRKLRMDVSLEAVIQSRTAFFNRNLEQGVFKELKKVQQKYPYISLNN